MATKVPVRLRFDPDLPLFATEFMGAVVEIFFYAHQSRAANWKALIDSEESFHNTLEQAWQYVEQTLKHRTNKKPRFYYPLFEDNET